MAPPYQIFHDRGYLDDLDAIDPFDIPIIREAILRLDHQAERETGNRRRLRQPVSWRPAATWQLRMRGYRVLYDVQEGTVTILRVRFKGSVTTEEMGS
jgi:mRNA-degrading endonuclease RelE of RelBE toxin-antitoxin system